LAESLHLYQLSSDGDSISFDADQDAEIVMLSGEPIDEPLAHYGPFVMNNQTQIMEAMRDYQMGKMGILIEEH
jgi:redox-sensitive bicupin YhaK (pirin superfamily)